MIHDPEYTGHDVEIPITDAEIEARTLEDAADLLNEAGELLVKASGKIERAADLRKSISEEHEFLWPYLDAAGIMADAVTDATPDDNFTAQVPDGIAQIVEALLCPYKTAERV